MLLNKEAIYLDINKNISIFRIREEYYNDIMCSINKNEISSIDVNIYIDSILEYIEQDIQSVDIQ